MVRRRLCESVETPNLKEIIGQLDELIFNARLEYEYGTKEDTELVAQLVHIEEELKRYNNLMRKYAEDLGLHSY